MADNPYGIEAPTAPQIQSPWYQRALNGLLGTPNTYNGLLSDEQAQAAQRQAAQAMGAQLLQSSGPSPYRTSLGQALGSAIQAGQQSQGQATEAAIRAAIIQRQMQPKPQKPIAAMVGGVSTYVDPAQAIGMEVGSMKAGNTPSSLQEYDRAVAQGYKGTVEDWKKISHQQPQTPAEIQAWNLFNSLPPGKQQAWIDFKRNSQPYQLGEVAGGKVILNKSTGQYEAASSAAQEAQGAATVAGATAGAKIAGESTATAQQDLPRVQANAEQALQTIEDFRKHPGFKSIFGWGSKVPTIPDTEQAGAVAYYDQIKGKTFLEAFNSLRGAGQITEVEGTKATDAIGRLNRSQSVPDANKALDDLESVIRSGAERARRKAGDAPAKLRYNPTTGKIE